MNIMNKIQKITMMTIIIIANFHKIIILITMKKLIRFNKIIFLKYNKIIILQNKVKSKIIIISKI